MRLRSLFIKPTFACTADCPHCRHRRELYRQNMDEPRLTLEQYRQLFLEARNLGTDSLHISGGEPTLYKDLIDLIGEGKRHNWYVVLNSNGSRIDPDMASSLLRAGLDAIILSIHSADPEIHDAMRRRRGHWEKVVESIETISRLRNA